MQSYQEAPGAMLLHTASWLPLLSAKINKTKQRIYRQLKNVKRQTVSHILEAHSMKKRKDIQCLCAYFRHVLPVVSTPSPVLRHSPDIPRCRLASPRYISYLKKVGLARRNITYIYDSL